MKSATPLDQRPRCKRPRVHGSQIEQPAGLWVGVQENLEASVEHESVDHVGRDPSSDAVRGFKDRESAPEFIEPACARQPGQPGSHNPYIDLNLTAHLLA